MNGNGRLTATENVIFYVSYGILTDLIRIFEAKHVDTNTDM